MRTALLILALLTCATSSVLAGPAAYDAANAHNPDYTNKELRR